MRVLLLATFELGRQPFALAAAAAVLRQRGVEVALRDLSVDALDEGEVKAADFVACHVPMHTATRLAARVVERLRALNPRVRTCCFGLYAPVNAEWLASLGVDHVLGGECEHDLARCALGEPYRQVALEAPRLPVPDRTGLPALERYARLVLPTGDEKTVGYTEASRGCKHLCRHCPIVPVYGGRFRIVERDVVLADIAQQVEAGARHVTFGDPDFLNGPGHAMAIVGELHARWPWLSFDATIKVEHLRRHARLLPQLLAAGCAFVTTAVESHDDRILERLDKGHTRADFEAVLAGSRAIGLALQPTFVAFTPWTTLEGYVDLLDWIAGLGLASQVPPVQLTIRLLIPPGSRLLEQGDLRARLGPLDRERLIWPWVSDDPRVDALQARLEGMVATEARRLSRVEAFHRLRAVAYEAAGRGLQDREAAAPRVDPITVPFLTEPWY